MLRSIREQPKETPQPAPRQIFQERQRITGLPLYFQGYLSVRHSRCQEFRMYWTELRGTMLFFYDDKKAPTYSQKLDISALISATNVSPDENGSAQFILMLSNGELELKANDCEHGKEWKGFILTVTRLSVPPDESLLPGQLGRMHEVLQKEKKRRIMLNNCPSTSSNRKSPPSCSLTTIPAVQKVSQLYESFTFSPRRPRHYYPELWSYRSINLQVLQMPRLLAAMATYPGCFYAVSRQEAIEMLEKNPSCGNLILRPSSDSKNYAITIRRELEAPHLKHYKVISKGTSYFVELERQVTLPSLQDVVNYFVTQTQGNLKPFVIQMHTAEDPVL
ncbi:signal-transducing adaptor protein 1 isoform X1 [Falco biarmicus]|uniref:signal-transducing adaptor protein 1 isoform X1 n=1 Tax=Falco cherrug TaxID=345164 RepID=UPI00247B04A7|nr:signal-transducing adaptor protein 1 isoform X1 [Falco cherrug]XP_055653959.1 signal-transducing adaptor protein 1 isoform X1 [Falco peregrinus]XP_056182751.1 signal-transducing adaptor protein 1 isoform X1 [Falco biarmicus]